MFVFVSVQNASSWNFNADVLHSATDQQNAPAQTHAQSHSLTHRERTKIARDWTIFLG